MSWSRYPKIYNFDHPALDKFYGRRLMIQEKVDGSQFSFGVFDGELKVRSKGREFNIYAPDNLFAAACDHVSLIQNRLVPGWTYRAEVLCRPKHNTLKYGRVAKGNLVLFDVSTQKHRWLSYQEVKDQAQYLEIDVVPVLGYVDNLPDFASYLDTDSFLGGCKIEGVVMKPVEPIYGVDGYTLLGKFVSPAFREKHSRNPQYDQKNKTSFTEALIEKYRTEARWNKAIQHLRDDGKLTYTEKDIGALLAELHRDFDQECKEEILMVLWRRYSKDIKRGLSRGFPEYYKKKLLQDRAERNQALDELVAVSEELGLYDLKFNS